MNESPVLEVILNNDNGIDGLSPRRILLKTDSKTIIGRSSRNHDKNMRAADNNMYIDSPVISREHAIMTLGSVDNTPTAYIEDTSSLHGTRINNIKLPAGKKHMLKNGDVLKLGASVTRDAVEYTSQSYVFESKLSTADNPPTVLPAKVYSAPDYLSSCEEYSESESSDHDQEEISSDEKSSILDDSNDASDDTSDIIESFKKPASQPKSGVGENAGSENVSASISEKGIISASSPFIAKVPTYAFDSTNYEKMSLPIEPGNSTRPNLNAQSPHMYNSPTNGQGNQEFLENVSLKEADDSWLAYGRPSVPPQAYALENSNVNPPIWASQYPDVLNKYPESPEVHSPSLPSVDYRPLNSVMFTNNDGILSSNPSFPWDRFRVISDPPQKARNSDLEGRMRSFDILTPETPITTTTEFMDLRIEQNKDAKAKVKKGISIDDILGPAVNTMSDVPKKPSSGKRKADEMLSDVNEERGEVSPQETTTTIAIAVPELDQDLGITKDDAFVTTANAIKDSRRDEESQPPAKKAKRTHGASRLQIATSALAGAVVGGVSVFAALAFLPESYFL